MLEFDMVTNALVMKSQAPTVMILGILGLAHSAVTQGQVMKAIQSLAAGAGKIKLAGPNEMPPRT